MSRRAIVIAGYSETRIDFKTGRSAYDLAGEALAQLLKSTGGGQISAGQPGLASGGLNLAEAVRQMFGEAGQRQVRDPKNALVTGIGVVPYARNWGTSTAMILEA